MTAIAAGTVAPRVAENLNRALHTLFGRDEQVYLLGEDLLDPYGGAFKVSRGLSSAFPDRVMATPLSEGGILGVGGGLALCGNRVIVEIMFGDFLALGFDQVLNFASKSVSMYGQTVPVPLLVRCPVGGNRGYGPTHSQSPQKHFIGIPNLALYELSPFHDAEAVLETALGRGTPGILFEDKVLYTCRMYRDNRVDDQFRYRTLGSGLGWAHTFPDDEPDTADFVVLAPGGMAHRAIDAARALNAEHGRSVHILTPAQLYPLDIEPVLPLLAAAGRVAVVEESTAGGTWGSEVARLVHERIWSSLAGPVLLLNSADSIIPTAGHLESRVLLGADDIRDGIRNAAGWDGRTAGTTLSPPRASAPVAATQVGGAAPASDIPAGIPLTAPKLNNNDLSYLVVDWLVAEGEWVEPDTGVISLDTSKAVEDLPAPGAGYLHRVAAVGEEMGVGEILGYLLPERSSQAPVPASRSHPLGGANGLAEKTPSAGVHRLDRAQQGTAAVVTKSHREVPTGFTVIRAEVDGVLETLDRLSDESGAALGLAEVVVKAVAAAHRQFPLFFGSLLDDHSVSLADAPHIGVTVDVDGSLYVPVVEDAHEQSVIDIADTLMDFRMKAVNKEFAGRDLVGGNIAISLNPDPGVVLVHPIVLWPQLCMLSLGAIGREYRPGANGALDTCRFVHLGIAYDHRVINGRDAVQFLTTIKQALEEPTWLNHERDRDGEES
ncbi:2-oxo acid dehydrogenase subunit E2 [Streptomyces sp. NPDC015032]|uniref:2-oxo acid dehydrogenase subunit E2 n=1 Tax=Streptomyces sp. NPDC015032 TaxID=3364937 RepID=UPI0036FC9C70